MELNNKDLLEVRNNLLDTVFSDNLDDINNVIKELETNENVKNSVLTTINWDKHDLEGKTDDEIKFIIEYREFIQSVFNEYQIRSVKLLTEVSKELEDKVDMSPDEKRAFIEQNTQMKVYQLMINMFIKCGNWGINTADTEKNKQIEDIENCYITEHNKLVNTESKLKDAEYQIKMLEGEVERLKNKKFLGIFKI